MFMDILLMLIIGAVGFYILRVLFQHDEYAYMTLLCSLCALAMGLTNTDFTDTELLIFIIAMSYLSIMSVIAVVVNSVGGRK